jgi:hypothetical protein
VVNIENRTFICDRTATFGFINEGESFGKLLSKLGQLSAEDLFEKRLEIAEITKTERQFVKDQCALFCVSQNLNVVITDGTASIEKGVLTTLKQPQRDWSGSALYAKSMEATKEVHKRITQSTKRGEAKAYVKKRMKTVEVIEGSDDSPGEGSSKRQKIALRVVGVNGIEIPTEEETQTRDNELLSEIHSLLDTTAILEGNPGLWNKIEDIFKNEKGLLCIYCRIALCIVAPVHVSHYLSLSLFLVHIRYQQWVFHHLPHFDQPRRS